MMKNPTKRMISFLFAAIMLCSIPSILPSSTCSLRAYATEAWGWPVPASTAANTYAGHGLCRDIPASGSNVEVLATRSGTVVESHPIVCNHKDSGAGHNCVDGNPNGLGTYGNYIELLHVDDNGTKWYSLYAHLAYNTIQYKKGDIVQQGALLGYMGSTGASTGQHLHFEIRNSSHVRVEPLNYVTPGVVIRPDSKLNISNYGSLPSGKLTQDKPFPVNGIVTANTQINHVWGGVYKRGDGRKTSQYCDVEPNTTSYNLTTFFDPNIKFNDLPVGYYTYKIEATTTDGQYKEIHSDFQIGDPKTYTVIYNANCGEGTMENSTMTYDSAATLRKNTFTRAGYSFECWSDGKGNYYSDQQSVKNLTTGGSITLWAKWKPNTYSVKYDANTGSGTMENSTMTYDLASKLRKNTFTKTGYSFECWSDGKEPRTYYSDQQSVKNLAESGTVTLWVKWKPNTYTIRYDANTGSGTMENSTMTYNEAAKLRKNTFTRTGYTFECWSDGKEPRTYYSDQQSVKNLAESGTVTLWAKWKPNTYTVTLNPNGGTVPSTSISVSYNGTYSGLTDATRTGYVFAGWYTEKEGGTRISPSSPVQITANQTLYAHWVDKTAPTISNVTAESVSMEGFKINATVSDDTGLKAVNAYVSTWRGYDTDGKEITLKQSGGTWTADVKISDFNNSYGAYYFRVAATDVNGNTISADTVEVKIGVSICTFDPNGGTVEPTSKTLVYGYPYSRLAKLPIPNRTGYTFDGWYTAKTDGTKITDDVIVTTTEDHTLYARWSPNYATVHFNTNGGTITDSTEYYADDNGDICLTETNAVRESVWIYNYTNKNGLVNASSFKLSRNNYKFVGWSTDPASETIFDQDDATVSTIDFFPDIVSTNGSVTFYARWEIDPPKNIDLRNGDQFELGITNDQLTFSSNEPRVAVISPSGVITALGPGEAIITILDEDNNAIQINITVLPVMMIGDVDLDRELTITDVILLQKWLLTEPDTSLPDWVAGDMNSDGKLNAIDLTLLKQMLLK